MKKDRKWIENRLEMDQKWTEKGPIEDQKKKKKMDQKIEKVA